MAFNSNNARLLVLTARKSDVEYRLTMMVNRTQQLAQANAELLNEKYEMVQSTITEEMLSGEADLPSTMSPLTTAQMASIDVQMAELTAAQNRLDLEQKKLETQHKAITAEEESVQKQTDNSIKNEFGYFN